MTVTDQQKAILQQLRDNGCAVVVFSPDDLQGGDRGRLESRIRADGWDLIEEEQALGRLQWHSASATQNA
ncbi:hypothetical protein D9M68_327500 [compost metagenome]